VGGFGAGKVQYYRYVFDTSATHTFTDTETQWSSGTIGTTPTSTATWYLHVKGYNGNDVGNGTFDYPIAVTQGRVKWVGGSANWDFNTTGLWQDAVPQSANYCDGHNVLLDDSASVSAPTITLSTTVAPTSVTNNSTKNYTISGSGVISGSATLTKLGSSTLVLGGSAANTYNGLTRVSAGTLSLGKTTAGLDAFAGDLTIDGGTVNYSAAQDNQIPNTANVTLSSGALAFGARNETIGQTSPSAAGSFSMSGGSLTIGSGTVNLSRNASISAGTVTITSDSGRLQANQDLVFNGGTIDVTGSTATGAALNLRGGTGTGMTYQSSGASAAQITGGTGGRVSLNTVSGSTTTFDIADAPSVGTEMTVDAIMTGSYFMEKKGAGVLVLSKVNTYNGGATVTAGTLTVNSGATLCDVGGALTANGGTLNLNNTAQTVASLSGTGGTINLGSGHTLTVNQSGDTAYSGVLATSGALTKTGAGNLTLSGANSFGGATTISQGTLTAGAVNTLSSSSAANINGGTLDIQANNQTVGAVTLSGGTITGSGATLTGASYGVQSGSVSAILGGSASLTKSTTGTTTLSRANTYTGDTTVSAGTLALSGSGSVANSLNLVIANAGTLDVTGRSDGTLTLAGGQTLKGRGTIVGVLAVASGSTLAPGTSVGALTNIGAVLLQGGGTNVVEIIDAPNAAGVGYDSLSVTGDIGVQADSGNPFTIKLTSLDGTGAPGTVTNFSKDTSYSWTIASASGSVTNFNASAFNLDTSGFSNDLAGGQFLMQTGSLRVAFTNNHPPVALATNYVRTKGSTLKIRIPAIMADLTSDADGHSRLLQRFESISGGMKSARGYTVTTNTTFLFYTNKVDDALDSINYVILDNAPYRPGDTRRYATNSITISVTGEITSTNNLQITMVAAGTNRLDFAGVPGLTYVAQYATNLGPSALWFDLITTNAPSIGVWTFLDDQATNDARFYRCKWQAQ
jgi:autotransporter-associated beta strand protein